MNEVTRISSAPSEGDEIRPDFIPADRYSDERSRLEKERLWPRIWHVVCRQEEIPEVGDYVLYEIYDESIAVVRTAEDQIKAFYNVCQHRGRRLLEQPRGRIRSFFCKFHGWKYDLQGRITHIHRPEAWDDCSGFKNADLNLKEPRADVWGGWVWVNMDPEAPSLAEWLGEIPQIMAPFDLEGLRIAWHKTIVAPVNWKVVIEAFNEGYHSGATHSYWMDYYPMRAPGAVHGRHGMYFTQFGTLPKAKKDDGVWSQIETMQDMIYYQSKELHQTLFAMVTDPVMRAITRLRDETPPDMPAEQVFETLWALQREELEKTGAKWPEKLTLADVARAGTSWHVVPNTIFLPSVDGVLWYRMRPYGDDPKQCVFDIWGLQRYAPGQEPKVEHEVFHGFEAARGVNAFLEQDFDNMFSVDRGMRSRGWLGARTNPAEEILIVNLHRVIDEFLARPPR